jgi:catalase (peroxidase I)
VNLLDMRYQWQKTQDKGIYKAVDRQSGATTLL